CPARRCPRSPSARQHSVATLAGWRRTASTRACRAASCATGRTTRRAASSARTRVCATSCSSTTRRTPTYAKGPRERVWELAFLTELFPALGRVTEIQNDTVSYHLDGGSTRWA